MQRKMEGEIIGNLSLRQSSKSSAAFRIRWRLFYLRFGLEAIFLAADFPAAFGAGFLPAGFVGIFFPVGLGGGAVGLP